MGPLSPKRDGFAAWSLIFSLIFLFASTSTAILVDPTDQWGIKPPRADESRAHRALADPKSSLSKKALTQQHVISADVDTSFLTASSQEPSAYPLTYTALLAALEVMQSHFFLVSQGTWPKAIDWTAAVMGTQISATLSVMTSYAQTLDTCCSPTTDEARDHENLINRYFTQIASFYFGENAFALRTQAYDDMLWVVLGWLEAIKFIKLHSFLHYNTSYDSNATWYAGQFIPQFSHRARLFYDLASRGWDTSLCGGGMLWNPYLAPYKNAITNELYIAASIGMYLYFPGDNDPSPFLTNGGLPPAEAHDVRYLNNAVEAYQWLQQSNMRNEDGLYVDGFHITGWRGGDNGSNGTGKCDLRDEKVYTYNQGVIISGLKGLWEATGSIGYLKDGHELVRDVIRATGWADRDTERKYRWAGLGRGGVMEESCDWSGSCSQNGQTFKGIFFHHLTLFCSPLSRHESTQNQEQSLDDDEGTKHMHQKSCDEYGDWIKHNAFAASVTRNQDGEFGQWWGRSARSRATTHETAQEENDDDEDEESSLLEAPSSTKGTDYRNNGVPMDDIWRLPPPQDNHASLKRDLQDTDSYIGTTQHGCNHQGAFSFFESKSESVERVRLRDINDRGRGRTVETQSGGLAVLRAVWRLVESRKGDRG